MSAAYLYDAVRTPRGKARPDGALASLTPPGLVVQLVAGLEARGAPREVDGMVLGCVGQLGAQGGNVALVAKLHAGLESDAFAFSLNNYCVSGLTAIGQAAAMVASGGARRVLAGGVEMMSRVPFMADGADHYRDTTLPHEQRYLPVALAADRLADRDGVSRAAMDLAALTSQRRAAAAEEIAALQASRVALVDAQGRAVPPREECVRPDTSEASLAALAPAFVGLASGYGEVLGPVEHRHTIAHAPPVCDGAALALVARRGELPGRPRARIRAYAEHGGEPAASLTAGTAAMHLALRRAGVALADLDRLEVMESFAVTIVRFLRDHAVDPDRVNVAGGHLAKGHPLGASGAILLSTLLDTLDAGDGTLGLVVVTGASGTGAAMVVERLN